MAPAVVYEGIRSEVTEHEAGGGLFAGQKFWLSHTVPQRKRFIDDLQSNGGEVVQLEKQAHVCLYDHARKNPPPGMHSYQFVERSIRHGKLEDLATYRIGGLDTRASRPVGSVTVASKGSKNPFTDADDQILWEWVKPHQDTRGEAGNLLYRQLEEANPRHTFQSWRDRWLKYVRHQTRESRSPRDQQKYGVGHGVDQSATSSGVRTTSTTKTASSTVAFEIPAPRSPLLKQNSPLEVPEIMLTRGTNLTPQIPTSPRTYAPQESKEITGRSPAFGQPTKSWGFSDEDTQTLVDSIDIILSTPEEFLPQSWARMESSYPQHTAKEWREYFEKVIQPTHANEMRKVRRNAPAPRLSDQSQRRAYQSKEVGIQQSGQDDTLQGARRQRQAPSIRSPTPSHLQSEKRTSSSSLIGSGRSLLQSHSPKTALSHHLTVERGEKDLFTERSPLARRPLSRIEDPGIEPSKRRKLFDAEDAMQEIPSTPSTAHESNANEDSQGTPTPRAIRPLPRAFSTTGDEDADLSSDLDEQGSSEKENIDPAAHTSPTSVHLFADLDFPASSTSSVLIQGLKRESDSSNSEFETAPGAKWLEEFASEKEGEEEDDDDDDDEEFETATEHRSLASHRSVSNTGELSTGPTPIGIATELPDPIGGWDALESDLAYPNRTASPDRSGQSSSKDDVTPRSRLHLRNSKSGAPSSSPSLSATSTSTLDLDLDDWLSLRTTKTSTSEDEQAAKMINNASSHQNRDQDTVDLLLIAAEATNMHKKLADTVYKSLRAGEGVPKNMQGVWTAEDDEAFLGSDARSIEEVCCKHGDRSVKERVECLKAWGRWV